MRTIIDVILERCYWLSQVILMFIAAGAAVAAFLQIRTFKLFELLKYLESSELRRARRVVIRELDEKRNESWWEDPKDGERFENSASDVCASYDILGRMIEFDKFESIFPKGGYGSFFRRHWARSIVQTHEVLKGFLRHRRQKAPGAYAAFTRLAEDARLHLEPPAENALASIYDDRR
jgi:hypothetical protein